MSINSGDIVYDGSADFIVKSNKSTMPKDNGSINLDSSLSSYTAPSDGYLYATLFAVNGYFNGGLFNKSIGNLYSYITGTGITEFDAWIPLAKGQVGVVIGDSIRVSRLTFYPSQNSV